MDENKIDAKEVVQLARLALLGNREDIQLYVRRLANRYKDALPDVSTQLGGLLREAPSRSDSSPLRRAETILDDAPVARVPVDRDSRMSLARVEPVSTLNVEPIWAQSIEQRLHQIVAERKLGAELQRAGLSPTSSALFTGAPGVGKTLAARWIAYKLGKPLVTLDLSSVISSFLGKTGMNVRVVLDYARTTDCVLLLDEFDAIAKRRDDAVEVGELKRLVTVLLQEIDDWPSGGLLLAATNHPELLDPAIWRRFDMIIHFPMPDQDATEEAIHKWLDATTEDQIYTDALARLLYGLSFSEIDRELARAKRSSIVRGNTMKEAVQEIVLERAESLSKSEKTRLAEELIKLGFSQRQAHEMTGISRDTIRKHMEKSKSE